MGIVRALIKIAATEALRGRTMAENRVHDSLIAALPMILDGEPAPVIAVSIDDSLSQAREGLFRTDVEMTLVLQMALARSVTVTVTTGEGEEQQTAALEIGDADAALDISLDLLDRQVRVALSDPDNPWAELFRTLVPSIGRIADMRLSDPESGRRYAARIVEMTIEPIAEPAPGQEDADVVRAGLDQIAAVADYADLAAILSAALDEGSDLFDWRKAQAYLLTTADMPRAIGIGTPDDGAEVPLSAVTIGATTFSEDNSDLAGEDDADREENP